MISKEIDFEYVEWERTPYEGVSISYLDNEPDLDNPKIPKHTTNLVKIDPECEMGLHSHDRDEGWTEFIIFPLGGNFEVYGPDNSDVFSGPNPVYTRIGPNEIYGIRNKDHHKPLFLISTLKPGFIGYEEIYVYVGI